MVTSASPNPTSSNEAQVGQWETEGRICPTLAQNENGPDYSVATIAGEKRKAMKNSTEQNTRGIGKDSNAHDQLKAKEEEKSNLSASDRCEIPHSPSERIR
jgi:hypothetical protein